MKSLALQPYGIYCPDMPRTKLADDKKKVRLSFSVDAKVKKNIERLAKGHPTVSAFINEKFQPKKP